MWLQHLFQSPGLAGPGRCTPPKFSAQAIKSELWGMCACLQLWANTSYPALWLIRTKGTSCFKSLTSQQHWPDWLGLQSTDLFPPLVAVLRVCSGALLASDGLSTSPSDEWHQAGEDRCVAKRLPGILFLPNGSVWCQENDPLQLGHCLDFTGKLMATVSKCLSLMTTVMEHWSWMLAAGYRQGAPSKTGTRCAQPAFWSSLRRVY